MNTRAIRTILALAVSTAAGLAATGAAEAGMVTVHEYAVGTQFLTALPEEARWLDERPSYGQGGWGNIFSTGVEFKAFDEPIPGTVPVCRFYQSSIGDHPSHFYTAFPDECEALKGNPYWIFEGVVLHVLPATQEGACAEGSSPIYRRYAVNRNLNIPDDEPSPLHVFKPFSSWRSTGDRSAGDAYWTREGLGADGVAFCIPAFFDGAVEHLAEVSRSDWEITISDPQLITYDRIPSGELVINVVRGEPGGWYKYSEPFQDATEVAGYRGTASGGLTVLGAAAWAPYASKVLFHLNMFEGSTYPGSGVWFTYLLSVDYIGADAIQGCARRHYDYGVGITDALTTCRPFSARRSASP